MIAVIWRGFMAVSSSHFTIESDGLKTPCRLIYATEEKSAEIVRFEEGLKGPARFSEIFKTYVSIFNVYRILVPDDPDASKTLKAKAGQSLHLSDSNFGEAFYRYYFPKMRKNAPQRYHWEIL